MSPIRFRYIEPFSRNYDLKQRLKNFNLKYLRNLWTDHVAQRTQPRSIQNLPLREISKRLSQFYSRNRSTYKTHFFHFSIFWRTHTKIKIRRFSYLLWLFNVSYNIINFSCTIMKYFQQQFLQNFPMGENLVEISLRLFCKISGTYACQKFLQSFFIAENIAFIHENGCKEKSFYREVMRIKKKYCINDRFCIIIQYLLTY